LSQKNPGKYGNPFSVADTLEGVKLWGERVATTITQPPMSQQIIELGWADQAELDIMGRHGDYGARTQELFTPSPVGKPWAGGGVKWPVDDRLILA
jgi:hypothetical protein